MTSPIANSAASLPLTVFLQIIGIFPARRPGSLSALSFRTVRCLLRDSFQSSETLHRFSILGCLREGVIVETSKQQPTLNGPGALGDVSND
jgi:hypothetical protein